MHWLKCLVLFMLLTLLLSVTLNAEQDPKIGCHLCGAPLTFSLDRLITDGQYKTVSLMCDHVDPLIKDTNFISELAHLAFGKYALFVQKDDYSSRYPPNEWTPLQKGFGILQVLTFNYDNKGEIRLKNLLQRDNFVSNEQNVVLLMPMQSDDRMREVWEGFDTANSDICFINISVVFYGTETSMKMANQSGKSMELFTLNYQAEYVPLNESAEDLELGDYFIFSQIDVGNSIYSGPLNGTHLHYDIFGLIVKKTNLVINTIADVKESVTNPLVQRGNEPVITMGNTEYYLSNFIARNLRAKDVVIQQSLEYQSFEMGSTFHNCRASNGTVYAELYNSPAGNSQFWRKFV